MALFVIVSKDDVPVISASFIINSLLLTIVCEAEILPSFLLFVTWIVPLFVNVSAKTTSQPSMSNTILSFSFTTNG